MGIGMCVLRTLRVRRTGNFFNHDRLMACHADGHHVAGPAAHGQQGEQEDNKQATHELMIRHAL